MTTTCRADPGAKKLEIPPAVLARHRAGAASLLLLNQSFVDVPAGAYTIGVGLSGEVTGPYASFIDVTLN